MRGDPQRPALLFVQSCAQPGASCCALQFHPFHLARLPAHRPNRWSLTAGLGPPTQAYPQHPPAIPRPLSSAKHILESVPPPTGRRTPPNSLDSSALSTVLGRLKAAWPVPATAAAADAKVLTAHHLPIPVSITMPGVAPPPLSTPPAASGQGRGGTTVCSNIRGRRHLPAEGRRDSWGVPAPRRRRCRQQQHGWRTTFPASQNLRRRSLDSICHCSRKIMLTPSNPSL